MNLPIKKLLPFAKQPLSNSTRLILAVLFFSAIALRCFFVFYTPYHMDEAQGTVRPFNDEYPHFKYCLYLKENHSFPINTRILPLQDPTVWIFNEFEYAQPPLAYIGMLPFAYFYDPMIACRLVSVFLAAWILWLSVVITTEIFQKKDEAAVTMMAFLGFQPILVRIGSSVSNDNLAWLLSLILFRLLIRDRTMNQIFLWGILIGLGILTKVSFFIWIIFLWLRMVLAERELPALKRLTLITLIAIAISSPWLIRNQHIYGDWTGIVGGSGHPGQYLSGGSLYAFEDFITSSVRFFFFPVLEETPRYVWVGQAFVVFVLISTFLQYRELKSAFESPAIFKESMLLNAVNLLLFIYANLHWNFSETRLLFLGLFPLAAVVASSLNKNWGKAAPAIAVAANMVYLASLC